MMIHVRNSKFFQVFGLLLLMIEPLNIVLGQSHDQPVVVVQAVAPVFPPLAVTAAQDGTVVVDVQVDAKGTVKSLQIVEGPKLLHKVVEIATRRWVFAATEDKTDSRTVRLSFVFKLVSKETPSEELLTIFRPPYQVEVRTRFPTITKYADHPSKHNRRSLRTRNNLR